MIDLTSQPILIASKRLTKTSIIDLRLFMSANNS